MVADVMGPAAWRAMMTAFGFGENLETYDLLLKAYNEPHRAYHTAEHIEACLKHLERVKSELDRPHEVRLALWFHDAIYKPFSTTNEKDSALWVREFMMELEDPEDDVIDRVENMILITEHHANPSTKDETFMLDIDLCILSAPPDVYDQFEKNIRFEYKRVPKFIFKKKRKEILQSFLDMDRIYKTDVFFEEREAQARENLVRAVAVL